MARRMLMRGLVVVLWLCLVARLAVGQEGLLPMMSVEPNALVLAKTIAIKDARSGETWWAGSDAPHAPIEWSTVVLNIIDCYTGDVSGEVEVAVLKTEVDFVRKMLSGRVGGWSGGGPMDGLQVGDVAIWCLQKSAGGGRFHGSTRQRVLPNGGQEGELLTAPGQVLMSDRAFRPFLISGDPILYGGGKIKLPPIDRRKQADERYVEMILRSAAAQRASPNWLPKNGAGVWLRRVAELFSSLIPGPGMAPLPERQIVAKRRWLLIMLARHFPERSEADRFDALTIRLFWGDTSIEAEFIALLRKQVTKPSYALLPPIQNEDFHIEACEGADEASAEAGFRSLKRLKCGSPRALQAAVKWLDFLLNAEPYVPGKTKGHTGLEFSVGAYVAQATGHPELLDGWTQTSKSAMRRAKAAAVAALSK